MTFDWLNEPNLQDLLRCLGQARVVGGALRNGLLGLCVGEVDIATALLPEMVMARGRECGFSVHPTGLAHGTLTLARNGHAFEVTSLRLDIESDGRHAKVMFTEDWQADALRRDFTINALYCDYAGEIFDPVGGLADIHARRVRFVGEAAQRIQEDYLRILRFFRFFAQYGAGEIDKSGLEACYAHKHGLRHLSRERVTQELQKLIIAPRAGEAIVAMQEGGILHEILPIVMLADFLRLEALEKQHAFAPDFLLRLCVLCPDEKLIEKLRLSRAQAQRLQAILRAPKPNAAQAKQQIYQLGRDVFLASVKRYWADPSSAMIKLAQTWEIAQLPVRAQDLIDLGINPGPHLGQALRAIEAQWLASDFLHTKQALLAPYRKDKI